MMQADDIAMVSPAAGWSPGSLATMSFWPIPATNSESGAADPAAETPARTNGLTSAGRFGGDGPGSRWTTVGGSRVINGLRIFLDELDSPAVIGLLASRQPAGMATRQRSTMAI